MRKLPLPLLKASIAEIISEAPDRVIVTRLIEESHTIATAYLRQKARRSNFTHDYFGLSIEDLALDCIAELFRRDQSGCFTQLRTYFEAASWSELTDVELHIALRRLVFSKVNEALFRRYKEFDSSLAKLIRNLKRAAKATPEVTLSRVNGEVWLEVTTYSKERSLLPAIPVEILEAHLAASIEEKSSLEEALVQFTIFAGEFEIYAPRFPLTGFAQALRSAYTRLHSAEEPSPVPVLLPAEITRSILLATSIVQKNMRHSYVSKEKVDEMTLRIYFLAVRDILTGQFLGDDAAATSYFEALKSYMPELSEEMYRRKHRNVLEYFAKVTRTTMVRQLQHAVSF